MKKVIVITGGSDGLGKSVAKLLTKENEVYILAKNEKKLKTVSDELNCKYAVCDVCDIAQSKKVIDDIVKISGKIDTLINCAGLWIQGFLEENDAHYIKRVIETNFFGVVNMCHVIAPIMKKQKDGLIVNVNSMAGYFFKSERTVYNASKWAVTGFTGSLRMELEPFGIRVTDFHPGLMKTSIFDKVNVVKNTSKGLEPDEAAKILEFVAKLPKGIAIPSIDVVKNNYSVGI